MTQAKDKFWFKLRKRINNIEYFADKITSDTIDGKEYYIVTWERNGQQYQDEVLTEDINEFLRIGRWIKLDKAVDCLGS